MLLPMVMITRCSWCPTSWPLPRRWAWTSILLKLNSSSNTSLISRMAKVRWKRTPIGQVLSHRCQKIKKRRSTKTSSKSLCRTERKNLKTRVSKMKRMKKATWSWTWMNLAKTKDKCS